MKACEAVWNNTKKRDMQCFLLFFCLSFQLFHLRPFSLQEERLYNSPGKSCRLFWLLRRRFVVQGFRFWWRRVEILLRLWSKSLWCLLCISRCFFALLREFLDVFSSIRGTCGGGLWSQSRVWVSFRVLFQKSTVLRVQVWFMWGLFRVHNNLLKPTRLLQNVYSRVL